MHLGFDRSQYPGDSVMQSLWDSTSMAFAAAYLAPAPSHGPADWMPAIPVLKSMGWGLVPVYVGQQVIGLGSHTVTPAQGVIDAQNAATLAASATLDAGSVLYLDIENGGTMPNNQVDYVTSWVNEVSSNTSYWAGVYCSSVQTAKQITEHVGAIPVWAYHPPDPGSATVDLSTETPPDPARCGFATALVWQYRMNLNGAVTTIKWTDSATGTAKSLVVDLNSAAVLDPSKGLPTPVLDSLSPTSGTNGDSVTLGGSLFEGAADVGFGGTDTPNLVVVSDVELQAIVPSGIAGDVEVIVTNRWGNESSSQTFTVT